jgi:cytochrome c biogenesis protein CcdA
VSREEGIRRPVALLAVIGVGFVVVGVGLIAAGALADPTRNTLIAFGGIVVVVGGLVVMWTLAEWLGYRRARREAESGLHTDTP